MLFVAVSFSRSFEGMRGLNVTDVRRERIPLLWSNARQTSLTSAFYLNMERGGGGGGVLKCTCVCRRTKLLGRGVHSTKVREVGRR